MLVQEPSKIEGSSQQAHRNQTTDDPHGKCNAEILDDIEDTVEPDHHDDEKNDNRHDNSFNL